MPKSKSGRRGGRSGSAAPVAAPIAPPAATGDNFEIIRSTPGSVVSSDHVQNDHDNLVSPPDLHDPPSPISCVGARLSLHLPLTLQQKIWNGDYINLCTLLPNNVNEPEEQCALTLENGQLQFKKPASRRQMGSIEQFVSAFLIFMDVYLVRHPEKTHDMLIYLEKIRTAATRYGGTGWKTYDEQFRLRLARDPAKSWAVMDGELWVTIFTASSTGTAAMSHNIAPSQFKGYPQSQNNLVKTKTCFKFNRLQGNQCTQKNCQYLHICNACKKNHPLSSCNLRFNFKFGNK